MSEKTYSVHSIFLTVQGEGHHAGRLAVFVRFSGCSVWSGREEDRERDSIKSACARICDTEFRGMDESKGGGKYTAAELYGKVREVAFLDNDPEDMLIVFTGGEPALQVDQPLVDYFDVLGFWTTAIETSGTVPLKAKLDWVTLSPKPPPSWPTGQSAVLVMPPAVGWLKVSICHELKVLYPLYDPLAYRDVEVVHAKWVQPVDPGVRVGGVLQPRNVPVSGRLFNEWCKGLDDSVVACFEFVKKHPEWRISVQGHKQLGLP